MNVNQAPSAHPATQVSEQGKTAESTKVETATPNTESPANRAPKIDVPTTTLQARTIKVGGDALLSSLTEGVENSALFGDRVLPDVPYSPETRGNRLLQMLTAGVEHDAVFKADVNDETAKATRPQEKEPVFSEYQPAPPKSLAMRVAVGFAKLLASPIRLPYLALKVAVQWAYTAHQNTPLPTAVTDLGFKQDLTRRSGNCLYDSVLKHPVVKEKFGTIENLRHAVASRVEQLDRNIGTGDGMLTAIGMHFDPDFSKGLQDSDIIKLAAKEIRKDGTWDGSLGDISKAILTNILQDAGLNLVNVKKNPVKGDSILIDIKKGSTEALNSNNKLAPRQKIPDNISKLMMDENTVLVSYEEVGAHAIGPLGGGHYHGLVRTDS